MTQILQIQVSPQVAATENLLKEAVAEEAGIPNGKSFHIEIKRRSIDARGRKVRINLTVALMDHADDGREQVIEYPDVSASKDVCHIVGAGPAGLFAALRCIERGIKPVIIERGKDVRDRRRDLAAINKDHIVNPDSNYCFGEGGAGTYSDGKLYTRSNKRGDVMKILSVLVQHGASKDIKVDAHPHIGTNKLPQVIVSIRETILKSGGEIHFNTKLKNIEVRDNRVMALVVEGIHGEKSLDSDSVILATGHSARDVYSMLHQSGVTVEAKPFALGVRVEHPQELIDSIQYHCKGHAEVEEARQYLPAASYSLVQQVNGYGVYSFCMCPGGIIAPCATAQEEVVTNGWSPSKRNNPYANSGIVVGLNVSDFVQYKEHGPLAGLEFQKSFEHHAWEAGGKRQSAPAQRLADFVNGKVSAALPECSYVPGIVSTDMNQLMGKLGPLLREGFKAFGNKMRGYVTNDAVIVGVESRTSTPVRIPRDPERLHHPQIHNLFPCGEGAGYAGGIVSAAMDGERCAEMLVIKH